MTQDETQDVTRDETQPQPDQVVVLGPDGAQTTVRLAGGGGGSASSRITDLVEEPGKVMRIGTMVKHLLEEVRTTPLDEASRTRLKDIHASSIRELERGLAPELREELDRLTLPFGDDAIPSEAELRIAQAQLVGWLEGVFHGIQTTLFAQQVAARAQLEQGRQGALPPGSSPATPNATGTGQYL